MIRELSAHALGTSGPILETVVIYFFISFSSPVGPVSLPDCISHDIPCCLPVVQPLSPITRCSTATQQRAISNMGCLKNVRHGGSELNLGQCRWMQILVMTQKLKDLTFSGGYFQKTFVLQKFSVLTINCTSEKTVSDYPATETLYMMNSNWG